MTRFNRRLQAGLSIATLALGSGACVGLLDPGGEIDLCPNGPDRIASISIEPAQMNLRPGDQVTLTATPRTADGSASYFCSPPVTWENSSPAVASITPTTTVGELRAVAVGTAVIVVRSGGQSASSAITVAATPIASLAIGPEQLALRVGQSIRLSVAARDSAGNLLTIRTIAWSSNDLAVATVSQAGRLFAVESGTASVRATVEGQSVVALIPVTRDPPATRIQQISAGYAHTCAITGGAGIPDGTAFCWGEGTRGQLGNGGFASSTEPKRVVGTQVFTSIAAGQDHTCATATDNATYCWGANGAGQLGDGSLVASASPVRVSASLVFRSVAVVASTSCALVDGGAAYCWGASLVDNTTTRTPTPFAAALRFSELLDGGWASMCGRTLSKQVYCWGSFAGRSLTSPTLTSGTLAFEQVDASLRYVCGVVSTGQSYCWGSVGPSELGPGFTQRETIVPTLVQSAVGFSSLVPAGAFTCGIANAGAYCFGSGSNLSGSQTTSTEPYPVPDEGRHRFVRISGGTWHACAIDTTGGGWCWGRNYEGQLGNGDPAFWPTSPTQLFIR